MKVIPGLKDILRLEAKVEDLKHVNEQLLEACEATVNNLEMLVNNPSAWEHFDQSVSDPIETVVKKCRAAISRVKGGS